MRKNKQQNASLENRWIKDMEFFYIEICYFIACRQIGINLWTFQTKWTKDPSGNDHIIAQQFIISIFYPFYCRQMLQGTLSWTADSTPDMFNTQSISLLQWHTFCCMGTAIVTLRQEDVTYNPYGEHRLTVRLAATWCHNVWDTC